MEQASFFWSTSAHLSQCPAARTGRPRLSNCIWKAGIGGEDASSTSVYPIALGLAIRSNALWSEVTTTLRDLPFRVVFDHPEIEERARLLDRIERANPDVVLVECTQIMNGLEELALQIRSTGPAPLLVALHTSPELDAMAAAVRAGVFDFLYPPVGEKLRKTLERAQQIIRRKPAGKVLGFLSAKGGCGATTIACHVAAAIGRQGVKHDKHTLLIDLDLNTGMVRFLMRTSTPYSVLDAASNLQRLDLGYWKALASESAPGLEVVAAPAELVCKHQLNRDQVQHVLSFARGHYDCTLVDLGRGLGLLTVSVLDEIDELYLVTTAEVPALHLTKKIVEGLLASNYSKNSLRLIVNRMAENAETQARELEEVVGLPVYFTVANDYARLFEAYSERKLLSGQGPLGREFERLAIQMLGPYKAQPIRRRSGLSEWLGNLRLIHKRAEG